MKAKIFSPITDRHEKSLNKSHDKAFQHNTSNSAEKKHKPKKNKCYSSKNEDNKKSKIKKEILEQKKNELDLDVPKPEPQPIQDISPINEDKISQIENIPPTENKLDLILKNANKKNYDFDLYKNLKGSLKMKDKQCIDGLTKDSYFCLDCKIAICPNCPFFKEHNGHNLIEKYPYCSCDNKLLEDTFSDLEYIFNENPSFLDSNLVKNELLENVNNNIDKLFNKLIDVKNEKIKELDNLFSGNEEYISNLKLRVYIIKNDLKNFFEKQKNFLCLDVNSNSDIIQNNPEANQLITNLKEGSKLGLIQTNKDKLNTTFLLTYDLYEQTKNINDEIKYYIKNLKLNKEKYLNDFNNEVNIIYEDIEKLLKPIDVFFDYKSLSNDFYLKISQKIEKYNEKIDEMKKHIMENVNHKGNFVDIEKESNLLRTRINLNFENILDNQLITEEDAKTLRLSLMSKNKKKHPMKFSNSFTGKSSFGENNNKMYNEIDEIKLDKEELQNYFAYETLNIIDKNFRIKPKKKKEYETFLIEEIEIAKPIQGQNAINFYNKKTKQIIKKTIKFDKKKHKYLHFLNGCRSALVKDKLYIFGGVDKDNNITNIAYIYDIKNNELSTMTEMLKPHAYHSVLFLDYYKSIIIVGGENCSSCELFDLTTQNWRELPDLKIPRACCTLYLDKIYHTMYAFFGILGKISKKNNNFCETLECLEFRKLALGWNKIEYNNRSETSFRNGINQILPLNSEMLLVYGGNTGRDLIKKSALYILPKQEMVTIDNKMFEEIRKLSKKSKRLSKILFSNNKKND